MPKLITLDVRGGRIQERDIARLRNLPHLTHLHLDLRLSTETFAQLQHLTKLQILRISNSPISDSDLEALEKMTGLILLFFENTKVTEAGVQKLQKTFPDLTVEID